MQIERAYIDAAQVAKMVRKALKESFPGVPFSVRTSKYSGGASIDIDYLDGPPIAAVEAVAKIYAGSYFDGSIDYKGAVYHLLDGKPVRFLANFVFVNRQLSAAALRKGIAAYRAAGNDAAGLDVEEFTNYKGKPDARLSGKGAGEQIWGADGRPYYAELALATWFDQGRPAAEIEAKPSAELARLQLAGDDGYSRQCGAGLSHEGPELNLAAIPAERAAASLH
jgi:hypothetical protein